MHIGVCHLDVHPVQVPRCHEFATSVSLGGKRQVLYVTNRPKMLCRGMHVLGSELLKSDQKIIRQHRIAGCPKGVEVGVSLRIIPRCEVY